VNIHPFIHFHKLDVIRLNKSVDKIILFCYYIYRKKEGDKVNKKNKIYGGIYKGKYWRDFYSAAEAKNFSHKENRRRNKIETKILKGDY